jgi:hypothetical protein
VQVSAERPKEAQDCEPLNAAPTSLDAGDVGRVHLEARCVDGEAEVAPDFYRTLYARLLGRVKDAHGDVKRMNAILREHLEGVALSHTPGAVRITATLSTEAVVSTIARIDPTGELRRSAGEGRMTVAVLDTDDLDLTDAIEVSGPSGQPGKQRRSRLPQYAPGFAAGRRGHDEHARWRAWI